MNKKLNELIIGLVVMGKYSKPGVGYPAIMGENIMLYQDIAKMEYRDIEMMKLHGWHYVENAKVHGGHYWGYYVGCRRGD